MTNKDKQITSFGLISCCFDGDILRCHMRLVAYLIGQKNYQEIDVIKLKKDFLETFGYVIPPTVMDEIMTLCIQNGVVERMDGKLYPKIQELYKYDLSSKSSLYNCKHDDLLSALIDYAQKEFPYITVDSETAEKALYDFAQLYSLSSILARNSTSEDKPINLIYVVGRFLDELRFANEEMFNDAIGFFLSSTVLSIIKSPEFNNFTQKISNLNIMLDTRFLFKLLGFEGQEISEVYEEIIEQLERHGAKLYVFKHTIDEMCIILENAANSIRNFSYGKSTLVARHVHRMGWNKSDVQDYIDNIEETLENRGVTPFKDFVPYQEIKWTPIDMDGLTEKIKETYAKSSHFKDVEYRLENRENAIRRDVKSAYEIHNLRHGRFPQSLNTAEYVFVTTNRTFARVSKNFWREQFSIFNDIPPCLTDVYISTFLWIQSEAEFKSDFNKKKLIADICSILEPRTETYATIEKQIDKLCNEGLSEEKCVLLRTKGLVDRHLLDRVIVDNNPITLATAEEIYDRIVKDITEPKDKKIDELSHEVQHKDVAIEKLSSQLSQFEIEQEKQKKVATQMREKATNKVDYLITIIIPLICFTFSIISIILGLLKTIKPELAFGVAGISVITGFLKDILIARLKWKDSRIRNRLINLFETFEYHKSKSLNS